MKTVWIVKAFTGYKNGWQEIKRFDNPMEADTWLCDYIVINNLLPTDYTITRKEARA